MNTSALEPTCLTSDGVLIDDEISSIADLICPAGNPASSWLPLAISRFVNEMLKGLVEHEHFQPGRVARRDQLEKTIEAATLILKNFEGDYAPIPRLSDPRQYPLHDFLLVDDDRGAIDFAAPLHQSLKALIERCESKLSTLPKHKGKRPEEFEIDNAPSGGHQLCALMIFVLWEKVRGRSPGVNNRAAQDASAALWKAAGGKAASGWGNKNQGWRIHLTAARAMKGAHDWFQPRALDRIIEGCKDKGRN